MAATLVGSAAASPVRSDTIDEICARQAASISLKGDAAAKYMAACRRNYSSKSPPATVVIPDDSTVDKIQNSENGTAK